METLLQDLRYALRALTKNPAFSAIAILTLGLGIGANTALFSVVDAVLLRKLPVRDPQQLVVLTNPHSTGMSVGTDDGERGLITYHEYEGLRDQNDVLSGLLVFESNTSQVPVIVGSGTEGSKTAVSMISGNYFQLLGVSPVQGHLFSTEVDQGLVAHPVALVSYAFWQRRMQQNPDVLGQKIRIRKTTFDVIGVIPASFSGLIVGETADIWVPLTMQQAVEPGRNWLAQPVGSISKTMFLQAIGRLKPGVTLAQANTSINITFKHVMEVEAASIPKEEDRKSVTNSFFVVRDGSRGISVIRGDYGEKITILMGLVGLLLLLTCANVANLILARSAGRQRELAVRLALGAGRRRLVRQLLTESVLLASFGAVVGLVLAHWGDRLLLRMVSSGKEPLPLDVNLNLTVLAFTIGVTLLTGVLFGLAPALRATKLDLNYVLRGAARNIFGSSRGAGKLPMGKLLVGIQVAISLLLLIVAGLFVRSIQNLNAIQLGYNPERMILFNVSPGLSGYEGAAADHLFAQLLEKVSRVQGVTSATLSQNGLFAGSESGDQISFPGYTVKPGLQMGSRLDLLGPGYFTTVGIPVLIGRDVLPEDSTGQKHCWINQTFSKYYFGDESPMGRHIRDEYPENRIECEIVGVVADAKYNSLREKTPRRAYFAYFNSVSFPNRFAFYLIRYSGASTAVTSGLRAAVRDVDPSLDTPEFFSIHQEIDRRLTGDRMTARLAGFFGSIALMLACIGLYGVLSYTIARRTGEIGVRMALGAQRGNILGMVLREALLVTLVGIFVGLGAALAATRVLTSSLYGLTPRDPITLVVAAIALLAVATIAASIPAWRASRTDPMTALRYE
jgi:predicted permease